MKIQDTPCPYEGPAVGKRDPVNLIGGIEGGGTKFICAVGTGPDDIREEIRYPTTTPGESIGRAVAFFRKFDELRAVGIACFGPLDPNPKSATFGYVTTTPKPGWANTEFAGVVQRELNIPVGFDTDVNAAALAEYRWGAAKGLDSCLYLTVGTGIGGGAVVEGKLIHGMMHPEMGHIRIPHDLAVDPYPGACPYHGDCLEGLACGPAIEARWGQRAETLPPDHPAWGLEAHYIALGLIAYIVTLSPQRIILGGGVMSQMHLFPPIRAEVQRLMNGYIQSSQMMEGIDDYIVPPVLGNRAGVLGGIALGLDALNAS